MDKITALKAKHQELEDRLSHAGEMAPADLAETGRELARVKAELELYLHQAKINEELASAHAMLGDPEMTELAEAEIASLEAEQAKIEQQIRLTQIPSDPNDQRPAIIEIRAGAGGDEASLFARELWRMYARYAETHHLPTELISESPSEAGGYKEVIFKVSGSEAYKRFKYESGVHRVQRVPETESGGRIHTSTVTVAVLPEAEATDVEIKDSDIRIDVFRSSGPGGQSVNTTDSAVRLTYLPTGMVVTCQDEKSQLKNKTKALSVLRTRLLAEKMEEEARAMGTARLSQIGTGDRSEKIRTYNFPQDRLTDHRIGYSAHGLPKLMDGDLDALFQALATADTEQALERANQL